MLDRCYFPNPILDGRATLEGDEARHLIRARRAEVGALVELFDGRGSSFLARVSGLGRDRAELTIEGPGGPDRSPRFALTLASAVPKGERFDWLIEKATELGVARLVPLIAERSSVDPRSSKIDRLRRLIVEASKQCRRDRLMELAPPTPWASLVDSARGPGRLFAHPGGGGIASSGWHPGGDSAILAIGPEGGFSEVEVDRALEAGWRAVGLGPTILRVETAALAAASTILALARSGEEGEATR